MATPFMEMPQRALWRAHRCLRYLAIRLQGSLDSFSQRVVRLSSEIAVGVPHLRVFCQCNTLGARPTELGANNPRGTAPYGTTHSHEAVGSNREACVVFKRSDLVGFNQVRTKTIS